MDENEMSVSADVSEEEIPENARQSIIAAVSDQELFEDEPKEYDIHPSTRFKEIKENLTWTLNNVDPSLAP